MTEQRALKSVAIFGVGRIGRIRLENVSKNPTFNLKYVIDINKNFILKICSELRLKSVIALDLSEMDIAINDDDVVGLFVCSPTSSHEEIITKGLNAGKHIFCEKPLSVSYATSLKCCQLAKKRNRMLHCSFQRRFDPSFRQIYNRSSNEVGQVTMIRTISRDPRPPTEKIMREAGCTIFLDSAIHDIDIVCWLAREWPSTIYAVGHGWSNICKELSDCDVINITFKFPSGIIGTIEVNRYSPAGYDQRVEITGINGTLRVNNIPSNFVEAISEHGHSLSTNVDYFLERYSEAFQLSTNHFLRALNGECEVEINEEIIVNLMKIADLCEESWRSGKQIGFQPIVVEE